MSRVQGSRAGVIAALAFLAALTPALIASPNRATAQGLEVGEIDPDTPVALVADAIEYDSEAGTLTATGNVEVFYGDRTLTADTIVYDSRTERIRAEGDIVLRDPSGATVYADVAELDVDLVDGIVEGAESVIAAQTVAGEEAADRPPVGRLAAVEARRFEGRFNALNKAVYSPCDVCADDPTPLWRIRARRVIHDEEEGIIHYEDAFLDVFGVPIAYLPYFRHPDPTVERASGFLVPEIRLSDNYGLGFRAPYYWVIDDQTDFTFQPFVTSEDGIFFDGEFRRAFDAGLLTFRGSFGRTDLTGDSGLQGHVDTDALFTNELFGSEVDWGWDVEFSSDDAYLRFFDISSEDRLTSEVFVRKYDHDSFFELTGLYFQSLRDDEPTGVIPRALPDFAARQDFEAPFDARVGIFGDAQVLLRDEGVNTSRFSLGLDFEREAILPFGLALTAFGELRTDIFNSSVDSTGFENTDVRFAPLGGIEARYPLIYDEADGDAHIIEPIVQFIGAPYGGNDIPFQNEDSQQTEFDVLSLFDRSHFSGIDQVEEGPRFNLGLRYERLAADGLALSGSVGRTVRFADADEFLAGTGLTGTLSDYVADWRASFRDIVSIEQRVRIADDGAVSRNEIFGDFAFGPGDLSVGYVFLEASPFATALEQREEITVEGGLQLTQEWGVEGFLQRDLEQDEFVEIGGTLSYANECCAIDMFLRRRFTESEDTPASTSFGLQVRLLTLGASEPTPALFAASPIGDLSADGSSRSNTEFTSGNDR
ncbi:MAG: LPS assembly protein LptD [Pseudomonadota bacterium]